MVPDNSASEQLHTESTDAVEASTGIPGVLGKIQERQISRKPTVPQAPQSGQSFPAAVHRKQSKVALIHLDLEMSGKQA